MEPEEQIVFEFVLLNSTKHNVVTKRWRNYQCAFLKDEGEHFLQKRADETLYAFSKVIPDDKLKKKCLWGKQLYIV